ncbi:MAG: CpaD family pilus assembly protein [Alphaproteobacteria bacterium]|nr:CpaD family pilus assembly protein [Alphaproteobacteria bacterium]
MQAHRLISLAGALVAGLALSACDVTTPSQMMTQKIRIKDHIVTQTLDAGRIDPARLNVIADDFTQKASNRKMALTVSYLAGDAKREGVARKQGNAYKKAFEQRGVAGISVATVPLADKQYAGKVVVTYKVQAALAPKDCKNIPGYQGADDLDAADQYQFGCNMKTAVSRMIADPSDLLGKGGTQDNDSRRSGAVVETYKSGKPNQPMKGFQASQVGGAGG